MRNFFIPAVVAASIYFSATVSGQNLIHVDDNTATPGSSVEVTVRLDNSAAVQGYQCALSWDSNIFTFDQASTSGLDIEDQLDPFQVEFFTSINDDQFAPGIGWAACAAIFDFSPPFGGQTLAPGINISIVRFQFQTAADNALVGSCSAITPVNNMGHPVIQNILTIDGISNSPDLEAGNICFTDSPPFIRGDSNDDGSLNLADAIFLIGYYFAGGSPPPCRASANSNGDAVVDIGDVIFVINHQFLAGPQPGAPYPSCGADPAGEAGIGCELFSHCP
ncbi:MAG: cohesin domain-containing protein [Planctomycetota bacterium]|nr:cohesin domain-containing protein [Planctomycetota bacterium]